MKQTKLILLLPAIELLGVILPQENIHYLVNYVRLELVVVLLCVYLDHGMKQSMALLLLIWVTWLLITNEWNVWQEYDQWETSIFAGLVWWRLRCPDWIPSDPPSKNTIQIAFRYGDKAPFIAKVFPLLGLNVTSVAVIIGDEAMVPIGPKKKIKEKSGKVDKRPRATLSKWVILDTGVVPNDDTIFTSLGEAKVKYAGCMEAVKPIISQLDYWSPLDTPSSLMSKILARSRS